MAKLIYEATKVAVKTKDLVNTNAHGTVEVDNIHAPRKHSGAGRVTLKLADGTKGDYNPAVIGAKWA
jgi:hypothetical protein